MYREFSPMFLVDDVDGALAWYADAFGATLQHRHPKAPPYQWVSLLLNDVEIMVAAREAARRWYSEAVGVAAYPANVVSYVYVDDARELYGALQGKAEVVLELVDQFYGVREFAVRDPFGVVWVFAEELG